MNERERTLSTVLENTSQDFRNLMKDYEHLLINFNKLFEDVGAVIQSKGLDADRLRLSLADALVNAHKRGTSAPAKPSGEII